MKRHFVNGQALESDDQYAPPGKRPCFGSGGNEARQLSPAKLDCTVWQWSSYQTGFHPRHVLVKAPENINSRWMSSSNIPTQFITLKLDRPAVVEAISFSKALLNHVCQLRLAKVYGGLQEDQMVELGSIFLSKGKLVDHFNLLPAQSPDLNSLKRCVPCQYIKIVPLESYDNKFHFTIWYLELFGYIAPEIVLPACNRLQKYLEEESMRLCVKFLREKCHLDVMRTLLARTGMCLEDEWLTKLHQCLVERKDFKAAEQLCVKAAEDGLFDNYVATQIGQLHWSQVKPIPSHGQSTKDDLCWPVGRAGHDMCMDSENGVLYLFGGWSGVQDLADLWQLDLATCKWRCLSLDTEEDGGPSARSCHKICMDIDNQHIYVLGQFYEPRPMGYRTPDRKDRELDGSSFYRYCIRTNSWEELAGVGDLLGSVEPTYLFDHRMCFDRSRKQIYAFGGRKWGASSAFRGDIVDGLLCYEVVSNTWRHVVNGGGLSNTSPVLQGRLGHAMIMIPDKGGADQLLIIGGYGGKETLMPYMQSYNPDTNTCKVLTEDTDFLYDSCAVSLAPQLSPQMTPSHGPIQCTHDAERGEIVICPNVFGGDVIGDTPPKQCGHPAGMRQNNYLFHQSLTNLDQRGYLKDVCETEPTASGSDSWPKARSLHCFLYDDRRKKYYLFGGWLRPPPRCNERLDDLWVLTLEQPTRQDVVRRISLDIRKQQCLHLVSSNPSAAIRYLQTDLRAFVDKDDAEELEELHSLCNTVLQVAHGSTPSNDDKDSCERELHKQRIDLFKQISCYIPEQKAEPRCNLHDVVEIDVQALYHADFRV